MDIESVYPKNEIVEQLVQMGFEKAYAEQAYDSSQNKSLESLLQYIEQNPYDPNKQNQVESQQTNNNENQSEKQKEENKNEQNNSVEQEGESISSMVNQEFSQQLQNLGFSKNVSEKALFLTQNANVEIAMNWIEDNKNQPDYEEELRIVKQEENKPKMTPEEAAKASRELQIKLREKRAAQEKKDAEEREKARIVSGKQMTETKRILEEQQRKRDMEMQMKAKKQEEIDKNAMLLQLQRDKEERFGKKFVGTTATVVQEQQKTPIDNVKIGIQQVKTAHPNNLFPGTAQTCFKTIKIYVDNILKNPGEEKFKKVNSSNPNFQQRVGQAFGGIFILQSMGFVQQEGFLLLGSLDQNLFQQASQLLEKEL